MTQQHTPEQELDRRAATMTTRPDHPAFPAATASPGRYGQWPGLTKREYAATAFLAALDKAKE